MSLQTLLAKGEVLWHEAATTIENWITAIENKFPQASQVVLNVENIAKQAASDAITFGQTALANVLLPFLTGLEPELDAALVKYLGPVYGGELSAVSNDAIDKMEAAVVAEVKQWALKAKANLATSKAIPVQPSIPAQAPLPLQSKAPGV